MNEQATTQRWIYSIDNHELANRFIVDQGKSLRNVLGGKGLGLMDMARLGLPVPPGLIVTTEACNDYFDKGGSLSDEFLSQLAESLEELEVQTGKRLGDPENPLLVSCRSGARLSMPGMMDTVLNIGLNKQVVEGVIESTGNRAFAFDLYRRLIQMFACVVMGVADEPFEEILSQKRQESGVQLDSDLSADQWETICSEFEELYLKTCEQPFPQDPKEQIRMATEAVFKSWNGKRAIDYRNATGIPHDWGTAVNIMTMVFGNRDGASATGVCFTRNPDKGDKELYGDFLINAQGEDVVAGIRNTLPIHRLKEAFPTLFQEFEHICTKLENYYRDMQDMEFTIEQNKLWILQTRGGKRTARAAIKIAVDMVHEGLITKQEALLRVTPDQVDTMLHPSFDPQEKKKRVAEKGAFAKGVNASPGAAVGRVAFDADTAEAWGNEGQDVIMIRPFTKPDDIHGMLAAKGILTAEGGATSHAAVVARQFGVSCVVGASSLDIDLETKSLQSNGVSIHEGDTISIDGSTGECFTGALPTIDSDIETQVDLRTLLDWSDKERKLEVWTNADRPEDARKAIRLGAQGIGLCRTEHMFFQEDRLPIVQTMILSHEESEKEEALADLLGFQRGDFIDLFKAMEGRPIIIRLIDPPLHEFIPDKEPVLLEVHDLKQSPNHNGLEQKESLLHAIESMHESNPMMGLRGVRLSILHKEIVQMQVQAIFEAACRVSSEGIPVTPKIMIPLVSHRNELLFIQPQLQKIAVEVMRKTQLTVPYQFGTMIELPRACVTADEIAEAAQFFSFGTNDLTQMTFGFSRDDAEAGFLLEYLEKDILPSNPFKTLDTSGVGRLIRKAVKLGRLVNPDLQVGVCGEHGGDPASIEFFNDAGFDYVSCSPFQIPIARLAAARAHLKEP